MNAHLCMHAHIPTHVVYYFFQIRHIRVSVSCIINVLYLCPCFIDEIKLYWFVMMLYLTSSTVLKFYKPIMY